MRRTRESDAAHIRRVQAAKLSPAVLREREIVLRSKNPERRTFGYRKGLMIWASINAFLSLLQTVEYFRVLLSGFGWTLEYLIPMSCLMQLIAGSALFRLPVRVPMVAVAILFFYAWTILDGLIINKDIGRTMSAVLGWQTNFVLVYLLLALSLDQATYCGPEIRTWMRWMMLGFVFASGVFCMGQMAKMGWAMRMHLYRGEMNIFRPVGLTDYPSQIGFQGFVGMVLAGSPIVKRNLKLWEWGLVIFFAIVILSAQYRSLYYGGLAVGMIGLVIMQCKRNLQAGYAMAIIFAASIITPLVAFSDKFAYGLRPAANDPAIKARQFAAEQMAPILQARPLTGIGPDPNFIISTNFLKIDQYSLNVLDNLYFTIVTCYGYIGAALAAVATVILIGGVVLRWSETELEAREWAFIATMMLISILVFSLTGNSIVYRPVGMNLAIALGVGAFTWKEEAALSRLPAVVVAFRRLMVSPLRRIGLRA